MLSRTEFLHLRGPEYRERVHQEAEQYQHYLQADEFSTRHLRDDDFWKLLQCQLAVSYLVNFYAKCKFDFIHDTTNIAPSPLSSAELQRISRAFYRHQIIFNVHGGLEKRGLGSRLDSAFYAFGAKFLGLFEPWEMEHIVCSKVFSPPAPNDHHQNYLQLKTLRLALASASAADGQYLTSLKEVAKRANTSMKIRLRFLRADSARKRRSMFPIARDSF